MDNQKRPNCCIKLWLMYWKNLRVLLFGSIWWIIFFIIFFIVCPICLMLFRLISDSTKGPIPVDPSSSINEKLSKTDHNDYKYYYSPGNRVLAKLLKKANLNATPCRNADDVYSELRKTNGTDLATVFEETSLKLDIGIVFPNSWCGITELPDAFSFALRLPGTKQTMRTHQLVGLSNNLYNSVFLNVQNRLSKAYLASKATQRNKLNEMTIMNLTFKDLPEREHLSDPMVSVFIMLLGVCLFLLTICVAINIVKSIVEEKELQIKEALNLVGIGNCLQWLSWYIHFIVLLLIASLIYTVCLTIPLPSMDYAYLSFTNWSTFLLILLVFSHFVICFCFMLSIFVSRTTRAILITVLVFFLIRFVSILHGKSLTMDILLCFHPVSAFDQIITAIHAKEFFGVGVQWYNIMRTTYPGENLSIGCVLLLMLLGSIISLIICLYVEQLRPGSYGMAKPWHFPCTSCCAKSTKNNLLPYMQIFFSCFAERRPPPDVERPDDSPDLQLIGPSPEGKTPGVEIKQLSKSFGKKEAVKGVTFDIYKDEITVLLGHNGAGKTTLISMLACITKPSSGTALINGYDIRKNPQKAQQCIGLCPQHNVLFKNLGVASHIRLFSQLRGLRGQELKDEVDKYLNKLNFQIKKRTVAGKLSGGNQRRLSIACALCGGVKVAICDEPSTGLDPGSRRLLWKLIIESKQDCSILLTTHHMDDGEVLGDRIVIISDGKLRCMGSLSFLKKQVNASSLLTCVTHAKADISKLTAFMAQYVSGIRPFRILGRDVCYKLPQSMSRSFPALFRDLERHQEELRLRGFGMSAESLEEIFMNYGAEDFDARKPGGAEKNQRDNDDDEEYKEKKKSHCCAHWRAMAIKKMLALYEYKVYFIILLLIPIIVFLVMLIFGWSSQKIPKLDMDVNVYKDLGITILASKSKEMKQSTCSAIKGLVGSDIEVKRTRKPVDQYVRDAYSTKDGQREMLFVLCAVSLCNPLTGWIGANELLHAAPMTINLIYNIAAQELFGGKVSLDVINEPYEDPRSLASSGTDKADIVMLYLAILIIVFAVPIVNERNSYMKTQQEVAGLGMFTYWLSHLVFDMLVYLIFALVLLLPLHQYGRWHHILFVLILIGLCALCFMYLMTCLCRAGIPTIAITFIAIVLLIPIVSVIETILVAFFLDDNYAYINVPFYLTPFSAGWYVLRKSLSYYATCGDGFEGFKNIICESTYAFKSPKCVCEHPIMYMVVWFLIVTAIIFWLLLMCYEYLGLICYKCKGCCTKKVSATINDANVLKKTQKIMNRMDEGRRSRRALVVQAIIKSYCCCGPMAVKNICFDVRPRVCCGLLGHNGAGKTSTFKMIVGDTSIDHGQIWINSYNIKTNRKKAIRELGYCPQFDSFFEYFTGRQMLRLFLSLRGVEPNDIKEQTEQLAKKFAFSKHLDIKIRHYSGGTKRKINAAVGCMGNSLICLDEPSSGVDPASRRHVWNILGSLASKGKAVLLTSHSMDEINALCSKVVMMVDGNIHYVGSNQHVKNKSAKGLELKLVLKAKQEDMARVISIIEEDLHEAYLNTVLLEKYEFSRRVTFLIPKEDGSWADIFAFVDRKRDSWQLEDYALQQPSLESVFLEIEESKKHKRGQS